MTTIVEGARTVLKAAFVARADALCTAASKKAEGLGSATTLPAAARFLTSFLAIEEKLLSDIRALTAPPGEKATLTDVLATQDKVIARHKEMLAAAQARNLALFERLGEEESVLVTAANAKFDAYGIQNCGTRSAF